MNLLSCIFISAAETIASSCVSFCFVYCKPASHLHQSWLTGDIYCQEKTYVADCFILCIGVCVCVCVCVCDKFGVFSASRVTQSITCGLQGQWAKEMKGY